VTGTTSAGQATSNATLEGLTISRSGREIVASMEGALSGDVSASGDATLHRFLVYDVDKHGTWQLTKQIAYRTDAGNRIPEVQAYGQHYAGFSTAAGSSGRRMVTRGQRYRPWATSRDRMSLRPGERSLSGMTRKPQRA
jgi:hypothetical protein